MLLQSSLSLSMKFFYKEMHSYMEQGVDHSFFKAELCVCLTLEA